MEKTTPTAAIRNQHQEHSTKQTWQPGKQQSQAGRGRGGGAHPVQSDPEALLQTITVESEQALHAIHVLSSSVLVCILLEVVVHLLVEVIAKEVAPEAEQRVHLLALADACSVTAPVTVIMGLQNLNRHAQC
jgi:hypothetical protein